MHNIHTSNFDFKAVILKTRTIIHKNLFVAEFKGTQASGEILGVCRQCKKKVFYLLRVYFGLNFWIFLKKVLDMIWDWCIIGGTLAMEIIHIGNSENKITGRTRGGYHTHTPGQSHPVPPVVIIKKGVNNE